MILGLPDHSSDTLPQSQPRHLAGRFQEFRHGETLGANDCGVADHSNLVQPVTAALKGLLIARSVRTVGEEFAALELQGARIGELVEDAPIAAAGVEPIEPVLPKVELAAGYDIETEEAE